MRRRSCGSFLMEQGPAGEVLGLNNMCKSKIGFALALAAIASAANAQTPTAKPVVETDGTIRVPNFSLPVSGLLSEEARKANIDLLRDTILQRQGGNSMAEMRKQLDDALEPLIARAREVYPVDIRPQTIAGIYTETITPAGGVENAKRDKVLIELHGGGFFTGARTAGRLESIPIASLSGIRVVAIDYRQAPEHRYPAASEDVAAVYRELLKHYRPENIGVFGCSAGGILSAQAVAWFQSHDLPRPGAISVACSGAGMLKDFGDSRHFANQFSGLPAAQGNAGLQQKGSYFYGADMNDPNVAPMHWPAVIAKFPPTLVVTGTRDMALSGAAFSHAQLVKAGVDARLYVTEGMGHGVYTQMIDVPEAKEVNRVIASFFLEHLGRRESESEPR